MQCHLIMMFMLHSAKCSKVEYSQNIIQLDMLTHSGLMVSPTAMLSIAF